MRLVNINQFARWCGVQHTAIHTSIRTGKLIPAFDKEKRLINAEHPAAREYMRDKGQDELPDDDEYVKPRDEEPDFTDIQGLQDMTHRQIVSRFGSLKNYKSYVDSLKSITDIQQRDIRVQVQRGELIERDFVEYRLFPIIDLAFQRLLTDFPESTGREVVALCESGVDDTILQVQDVLRNRAGQILHDMKRSIKELGVLRPLN